MASTPASSWVRRNAMVTSVSAVISACQVLRLAEHHRLGAFVVAARAALDQVGRQRERRAGEADQRHVAQRGDQQRHRVGDRRDLRRGSSGLIAATSAAVRIGWAITGPTSGTMSSSMPDARSGTTMSENRMAASTPCRRTGCSVISVISSASKQRLHHGVLGPQRPVLGQRTSGLPHEPHRHAVRFAAAGCGQIRRVGQVTAVAHRRPCCHVVHFGAPAPPPAQIG